MAEPKIQTQIREAKRSDDAEDISLRRVAARFLNENEEQGLQIIDKIVAQQWKKAFDLLMMLVLLLIVAQIAISFIFAFLNYLFPDFGHIFYHLFLAINPVIPGLLILAYFWIQYHGNFFDDLSDPIPRDVEKKIDKLFKFLHREDAPPIFIQDDPLKREVSRQVFVNKFRFLLLGDYLADRPLILRRFIIPFSKRSKFYLHVDVTKILKIAKAEPEEEEKVHKTTFDYRKILVSLSCDPRIENAKTAAQMETAIYEIGTSGKHKIGTKGLPKRSQLHKKVVKPIMKARAINRGEINPEAQAEDS